MERLTDWNWIRRNGQNDFVKILAGVQNLTGITQISDGNGKFIKYNTLDDAKKIGYHLFQAIEKRGNSSKLKYL